MWKKSDEKTLKSTKNRLTFTCRGKGRNKNNGLNAEFIQIFIKKKPKRKDGPRCLDFNNVKIFGDQEIYKKI